MTKIIKSLQFCVIGSLLLLASCASNASTLSSNLSVTVGNIVRISAIDDIILSPYDANLSVPTLWYNWEPFCIYSNSSTQFQFTARGDGGTFGAPDSFQVSSGTYDIPMRVYFFSATDGVTRVFPNATQTFNEASNSINCNGGTSSWVAAAFLRSDLDQAPPFGIYIGRIFMTVAPL